MAHGAPLTMAIAGKKGFQPVNGGSGGVMLPVVIVAVTALCLGYDAGVMSGAILPMCQGFGLSRAQEGWVMGCINLVAAPGALIGGRLADWRGRVASVAGTAVVLFVGPVIVACSQGFLTLLAGRLVTGVGVGLAFVLAPLYAAEVSPPEVRAGVVAVTEVLINLGVLLGYASAGLLGLPGLSANAGWRLVTGLAAAPALLTALCSPWLPESPRWLVQANRRAEAEAVLSQICQEASEVEAALAAIDAAVSEHSREVGWGEVLCPSPVTRRMLLAGVGVAFFQQASGSEAIVYYTPTILADFGITSSGLQNAGAMAIGAAKFGGACAGAAFLDRLGRRAGVVTSCAGVAACTVGLALLGGCGLPAVGLGLLCLFMVFFELGLAPAAFVLGTESYPVALRAKCLSLGMFVTRFLSGLVAVLFPPIVEAVSLTACLWLFAGVACLGVLWASLCVPETMGLSLEEVAQLFERPWDEKPAAPSPQGVAAEAPGDAPRQGKAGQPDDERVTLQP